MAKIIHLPTHSDDRGNLTVIEKKLPFAIKRVFFLYGMTDKSRGAHRHHKLYEAVVCLKGSFTMKIKRKNKEEENFFLNSPEKCLLIPPQDFRILGNFSHDCIVLALASSEYDPEDYIYEV